MMNWTEPSYSLVSSAQFPGIDLGSYSSHPTCGENERERKVGAGAVVGTRLPVHLITITLTREENEYCWNTVYGRNLQHDRNYYHCSDDNASRLSSLDERDVCAILKFITSLQRKQLVESANWIRYCIFGTLISLFITIIEQRVVSSHWFRVRNLTRFRLS